MSQIVNRVSPIGNDPVLGLGSLNLHPNRIAGVLQTNENIRRDNYYDNLAYRDAVANGYNGAPRPSIQTKGHELANYISSRLPELGSKYGTVNGSIRGDGSFTATTEGNSGQGLTYTRDKDTDSRSASMYLNQPNYSISATNKHTPYSESTSLGGLYRVDDSLVLGANVSNDSDRGTYTSANATWKW